MQIVTQLNPPIPMNCPKGKGLAHFVIDYGLENNLYWVIFIDDTGEIWTYPDPEVKARNNISYGRILEKAL